MAKGVIEQGPAGREARANVARIRKARGFTWTTLSRELDRVGHKMAPTIIRRLEEGNRRMFVDDIMALAFVLNVSPGEIIGQEEPPAMRTYSALMRAANQNIARNIKRVREERGISYNTLAIRTVNIGWGTTQTALAQIESGVRIPSFTEVVVIAEALGVDLSVIVSSVPTNARVTDTLINERIKSSVERAQLSLEDALRDLQQSS